MRQHEKVLIHACFTMVCAATVCDFCSGETRAVYLFLLSLSCRRLLTTMAMSIPQPWKLVVNGTSGNRLAVLSVLSISKAEVLEATVRGAVGRPTTDVSPIKVDADAEEVIPLHDVVEAVKLFESGGGYSGFAGMRAVVEPNEKTITLVAVLRRATTANPQERGSFARSSMDISGLPSSAQQSGDQW